MSFKPHFARFLAADPGRLHVAAHSHHFWPDVTYEAQVQCWLDAARLADRKWDKVFGEVVPRAQAHVARRLGLADPATVAFGPNTHGFVLRLLSLLPPGRPARVLTTDGEFHSFARQLRRLEEDGLAEATRVKVAPFADFAERFAAAAAEGGHDLVFFSQVFFNSGHAVQDLGALVGAVPDAAAVIVIDGYHGFLALPTDLAAVEGRAFYLAGGYKYAMAGEGAAFLHAPPGRGLRPRDTGWFASFGTLEAEDDGPVPYAAGGARFLGATFDPVGLYRFNAVMDWLDGLGLTVAAIHAHVRALQRRFVAGLAALGRDSLHPGRLVVPVEAPARGHFLAFRTPHAAAIHRRLMDANVVADRRGELLRFGFGLYHDADDIDRLCDALGRLLP
ncbi:MAG TPA: aminotransferase class V-fold PLP-dependent enzyme [Dongiaceae bacterium]|nr:aminotransferase class V-fold PLP-dependent enzyme [Dongiaceae bacterium]